MSKESPLHTDLLVKNQNELKANGILTVESFDESFLTLETTEGRINVEGEGLRIESLCKETGEIEVKGKISAIFYDEKRHKAKRLRGLFG